MKLLLIAALAASSVMAGDKEMHKIKKWALHKACESCLGEEAAKQWMIKVKSAAATCMKIDAPELDLPMYKYPYRAVGALVDGAYNAYEHNADGHHPNPHVHRPGRPMGHHHGSQGSDDDYLNEMMKKIFFKKMVAKMLEDEFMDDDDDDEDMVLSPGPMKFFKQHGGGRRRYHGRQRRQADERPSYDSTTAKKEMFELGDRLNMKLQMSKAKMEAEIGNFTCMLRECGVIDAQDKLVSEDELIRQLRKVPLNGDDTDGWLRSRLEEGVSLCHKFAHSVPEEVLSKCPYGPDLGRVKMYKKCFKMCKMRTCMNYDVKNQLEMNFGGSLEDLVETTQLEESELLPLVMTLLHGPEMDMH